MAVQVPVPAVVVACVAGVTCVAGTVFAGACVVAVAVASALTATETWIPTHRVIGYTFSFPADLPSGSAHMSTPSDAISSASPPPLACLYLCSQLPNFSNAHICGSSLLFLGTKLC